MSQENVEVVRRLLALWNRASAVGVEAPERSVALRELADLAGESFDPDIECVEIFGSRSEALEAAGLRE